MSSIVVALVLMDRFHCRQVQLSLMDQWILSRLAVAITACNAGFAQYELPTATTAAYNFWLYDLCDVYLESVKPVFQSGESSAAAADAARSVLLTCLDYGLRLLAPFMPFITEELWQRLPYPEALKVALPPSICVASYPSDEQAALWRNERLEDEMESMQRIARAIRSARASYLIPNKTKTQVTLRCADQEVSLVRNLFLDRSPSILSLPHLEVPCSTHHCFPTHLSTSLTHFKSSSSKTHMDRLLAKAMNFNINEINPLILVGHCLPSQKFTSNVAFEVLF